MSLRKLLLSENAGALTELSWGAFIRKIKLFSKLHPQVWTGCPLQRSDAAFLSTRGFPLRCCLLFRSGVLPSVVPVSLADGVQLFALAGLGHLTMELTGAGVHPEAK